jgi:hypothetical protein
VHDSVESLNGGAADQPLIMSALGSIGGSHAYNAGVYDRSYLIGSAGVTIWFGH